MDKIFKRPMIYCRICKTQFKRYEKKYYCDDCQSIIDKIAYYKEKLMERKIKGRNIFSENLERDLSKLKHNSAIKK